MKFRITLKSFNKNLINQTLNQIVNNLKKNNYKIDNVISLPLKIKRFCVLRSPHVNKDSREHFELKFYKKFLDVEINTLSILDTLLEQEIPAGISCTLKVISKKKQKS